MLNTIGNDFFENNPNKVLGEFSIAPYMNKIIVKGTKEDVEKYFEKENLSNPAPEKSTAKVEPKVVLMNEPAPTKTDFLKEHVIFATVPKHTENKSKETKEKPNMASIKTQAPNVEKDIVKVEGFKVRSIEDNVKLYTPHLSDNDIKAFVWYNQTLGVPMTGWEKWFIKGSSNATVKATDDVEYLNQQFAVIGKFQKGDVVGKLTKFTHKYQGIDYAVCRKLDGQLIIIDSAKIGKSVGGNVSASELKELVLSGSLYYLNGDYLPLHVYSNTDYEILKNSLESDKEFIIKEFGLSIYESYEKQITTNLMRVDAPKFEMRFKLNPFSEIARTTKAGILNAEFDEDFDETAEPDTVTQAFEKWVSTLKNSDYLLVSKDEFRRIIIYEQKQTFRKGEDDEREAYKGTVANAQIECVRLFSNFCTDVLDTQTKTTLNRLINLTYNRSMLINTTKVPVGFVCSNKFKNSAFELMPVQVEAFKFAVSRNNFCLALTVGFGKTSVGISLLSYFVSSGALKKPLIVVPKPVLSNWIKEMNGFWLNPKTKEISLKEIKGFIRQYGILSDCGFDIINIKNLDKSNQKFTKDISQKKSAITICTYEALEKMYIGDDQIREFVIGEWKNILTGEREESARQWSAKMLKLEQALNKVDRSAEIDIMELGFDGLLVDEAHRLKNMFTGVSADPTNRVTSSFKGSSSSRALRGFYMSMYIQKINGRIGFLTATPFSNTPLEVYTMLCFLGYNELTKNNVNKITKFVELFFNETVEPKVDSKNKIVYESVMKNYKNKPILNTLLSNTFLYKDNPAEAELKRPCIIRYPNNDFKLMLKMSTIQGLQRDLLVGDFAKVVDFMESESDPELVDYAEQMVAKFRENIASKRGKSRGGSVVASSKISALSPFAGSPVSINFVTDERWSELYYHSPKIRFTVDAIRNMMEYHKGREESNSSFLIYCEVGTNILGTFKEALEQICGFKRNIKVSEDADDDEKEKFDEVEIIEGTKTTLTQNKSGDWVERQTAVSNRELNRRDKVQFLFNTGKVKVIIGTSVIKEGLNLQTNCATLFILTPSWNSTDIDQVEGRIHRQGNKFGYARVITPVVARSMDSFVYQKYEEKKGRLADIWSRDGIGDSEDLNIDIPANKQKELILDNAPEIARIRGDMNSRAKFNLLNKATEDLESVQNAISKSGSFNELLSTIMGKTGEMVAVVKNNLKIIKALPELISKTAPEKLPSSVRNLKSRLETLTTYYSDLLESVTKADDSKLPVDLVNILNRSYNQRTYYVTSNYDAKLDLKEFLVDNGYKRFEIENLFEDDIFANIGVYTKVDSREPNFDVSLKKLKELYGASVLAEKLLASEGLSLTSRIEDLDALVERYKGVLESIKTDIEVNFDIENRDGKLIPKREYIEKLTAEAQIELDEENKLAVKSDDLGDIFATKTNPQLTYLLNDLDLNKCEIHYEECCDTNGKVPSIETKIVKDEDIVVNKPEIPSKKEKMVAISDEAKQFLPSAQYSLIKSNAELNDVRIRLNELVANCPKTYETEEISLNDKIAQLHYFTGGSDWYIIEKDKGDPVNNDFDQSQAFGYTILNGDDINAEFGWINIEEVKKYAELDLYWTPVKMSTLLSNEEVSEIIESATEKITKNVATESDEDKIADITDAIESLTDLSEIQDGDELKDTLDAIESLTDLLEFLK